MNNNNWRYKITTPEQLEWAIKREWPVMRDYGGIQVTGVLPKDGKIPNLLRFGEEKALYLVPKTIDELEVGDIINDKGTKREVSHLTNKRVFFKTEPCFETSVKKYELSDVQFMPYLPEDIFPKQ